MIRSCLALLALALLAPAAWSDAPIQRKELEADLELAFTLQTKGPVDAGTPLLADLTITNRSAKKSYPVIMPRAGCEVGVTEPYVWFTARLRRTGSTTWERVEEARPWAICGTGSWSWHKHVHKLKPGEVLDAAKRLNALNLDLQHSGVVEITAHYGFLTDREQPRLPGAEGPDDLGPMKGVPPFELVSKPVTLKVVRTLDLRAKRGPKKLVPGKPVRLAEVLEATLTNDSGAPVGLQAMQYAVWVEWRAVKGKVFTDLTREVIGTPGQPARTLATDSKTTVLGKGGWYDETLELGKAPEGGLEARVVVRIQGGALPRTIRSSWLRVD